MRTRGWIALVALMPLLVTCKEAKPPSPVQRITPAAGSGNLVLVVALFRHGVRAPLENFATKEAGEHSKRQWPSLFDWCVAMPCGAGSVKWGNLTIHGRLIASRLGDYYADTYKKEFGGPFKVRFWADVDQRTLKTAEGLVEGFQSRGVSDAQVDSLPYGTKNDLLFHPFKGLCGVPDENTLRKSADAINRQWNDLFNRSRSQLADLYKVLGCNVPIAPCNFDRDEPADICAPVSENCNSPIKWKGRFSYASSATEAFLLEYANDMSPVGWGYVQPDGNLKTMLQLHELYFDQTERKVVDDLPYVAKIEGSNLIREIRDVINRKVNPTWEGCPHAPREAQFVGLLGHDTNLASLNALLKLGWKFDHPTLPPDTKDLPENDALPAGALVFELRKDDSGVDHFIRVYYVTQTLSAMQKLSDKGIYRLNVQGAFCKKRSNPCEIKLSDFNTLVGDAVGKGEFLYSCDANNQQQCAPRSFSLP